MGTIASTLFGLFKRPKRSRSPWRFVGTHAHHDQVGILVDDERLSAPEGECLAVALAVAGISILRHSPVSGSPRGMFCLMGSCQECLVHVDGAPVLACMEPVRPGMQVMLDRLVRERPGNLGH